MPVAVVMPKFGLTMQEGTIQQWFKSEGEPIAAGEPLYEVETEKVLYEVEAPADGVVAKLLYPAEATVACASVVAVIAVAGEDPAAVAAQYAPKTEPARGPSPPPAVARSGAVVATPAARKLAKDHAIDLATLSGTGPGGRITREDVDAALAARAAGEQRLPLRGMRKTIAERMWKSLQSTAQLTMTTELDVTALVERKQQQAGEFPVTYTDLLVEAVAGVLRAHPRLRVTVDGDAIHQHEAIHIGVAVALDEGLIVPVVHDADQKSLAEIARESRALAEQARAGTLGVDAVSGGIFTITNLGMYGVDAFTPILQLPQVAILGVGRIVQKPAVHAGRIAIRSMMTLSLTFDHRIVDGAPAAAFLRDLAERLTH